MASMRWVGVLSGLLVLAGCGHGSHDASPASPAASASVALIAPANPNDVNAWHAFMGKAILAETHDPHVHPYAFFVPEGDQSDAVEQRHAEARAIHGMLGHTAIPGNMLALAGPDSTKVAQVIQQAFTDVPTQTARGVAVLYIGAPVAVATVKGVVSATGAELRVRAVQAH